MINSDGFDNGDIIVGTLPGLHREPDPLDLVTLEQFEIERMERRGASTRVDLGLDCVDAPVGKPNPLSPPDGGRAWLCHG